MTPNQRQAAFERFFSALAKWRADRLGMAYVLGSTAEAQLRRAEAWVATGKGPAPVPPQAGKRRPLKRKV